MSLFKFSEEGVAVDGSLHRIPQFKKMLEHKNAEDYISYVYHLCDYTSPYNEKDIDERKEILKKDFLDGKEPPKFILEAIDKYRELSRTSSTELLDSAKNAVRKLRSYFDDLDFDEEEDKGKAAKDLMQNLKSVGAILSSLKEWEEQIQQEKTQSQTRKGVPQTRYNT